MAVLFYLISTDNRVLKEVLTCSFLPSFHSCSSWGESFFIAIQVCVLLVQMFYYNKQMVYMAAFSPVYGAAIWFLTSEFASIELLSMLQACVIPLLLTSRVCDVFIVIETLLL